MVDLTPFANLVLLDHGLSVVVTRRADHTPHTTVVNAGVLAHPLTGSDSVAFVARGGTRKLAHLRADPTIALVVRAGWQWTAVEGTAQLIGPYDPDPDVTSERLRLLLREIFTAAGGTHDDWDTYDQVMRDERRTAVVVAPTRVYSGAPR
jgi:PPOX class probable F420-dependent enzyme